MSGVLGVKNPPRVVVQLVEPRLDAGVEQVCTAGHVTVERHNLDPEHSREPMHRPSRQPLAVDEVRRGPQGALRASPHGPAAPAPPAYRRSAVPVSAVGHDVSISNSSAPARTSGGPRHRRCRGPPFLCRSVSQLHEMSSPVVRRRPMKALMVRRRCSPSRGATECKYRGLNATTEPFVGTTPRKLTPWTASQLYP